MTDEFARRFVEVFREVGAWSRLEQAAFFNVSRRIFRSSSAAFAFFELLRNNTVTASYLVHMGLTASSAYRALKTLRDLALIEPHGRVMNPNGFRGGPRVTVWRLTVPPKR